MLIVSQNKEKVMWFGRAFNALEYSKDVVKKKGEPEKERHTICISDGCLEEVAEYDSKERCMEVLREFCDEYEKGTDAVMAVDFTSTSPDRVVTYRNKVFEFPEK